MAAACREWAELYKDKPEQGRLLGFFHYPELGGRTLRAMGGATEQKVAAVRLAHLSVWARSRFNYESFLRENSYLERYSS